MERSKTYRSEKPLGRIYDRVRTIKFDPIYNMAFDNRILSRFKLSIDEMTKARHIKAQYDIAMHRLMGRHENPVTEFEIWSTFILSKPRVGSDYKLQEEVGREVAALKDRFRSLCGEAVTGIQRKGLIAFSYSMIDLEKLDRFVAAMYTVTHDEIQEALRDRATPVRDEYGNKVADNQGPDYPMPLMTFPWLFHRELSRIAMGGRPTARQWKRTDDGSQKREDAEGDEVCFGASNEKIFDGGETLDPFDSAKDASKSLFLRPESPTADQSLMSFSSEENENENSHQSLEEIEFEEMELNIENDAEEDALDALIKKVGNISGS